MPAPVYATPDQLRTFVGLEIEASRAEILLRRASRAVDGMLKGAVYDTNADGTPADAEVAELLAEATALQVEYFEDTGDVSGAGAVYSGGSIGGVTLPSANRTNTSNQRNVGGRHSPEVIELLRESTLLVWSVKH